MTHFTLLKQSISNRKNENQEIADIAEPRLRQRSTCSRPSTKAGDVSTHAVALIALLAAAGAAQTLDISGCLGVSAWFSNRNGATQTISTSFGFVLKIGVPLE